MNTDPPVPERLWKYRAWDEKGHARRMIVDGELHYTRLEDLNDPFDLSWLDRLPTDGAELIEYAKQMCAKNFPKDTPPERRVHFQNMLKQIRNYTKNSRNGVIPSVAKLNCGVFCASAINDDVLMWSHYADHHKGVCIGIRTDKLTKTRILKVTYSDKVPVIDCWVYVNHDRELFINATRMKGLHWKYEEEWRTVDKAGPKLYPGCVDRIIIGTRATVRTTEEVFEAAMQVPGVEVYLANPHATHYKLRIDPVEAKLVSDKRRKHRR